VITMKYISAKSVLLYVFLCFTALYYLFRFALGLGNLAIAIQIGALCGLSIYGLMHITALKKQMPAYFYLSFLYAIILLTPGGLQGGIDAVLYGVKDYVLPISLLLSFWFLFNNRPILIERAFCTVFILGFIVSLIYLLESINVNALGGDFFHYTYKIKDLGLLTGANTNFITGFVNTSGDAFFRMPGPLSHNNSTGLFIAVGILAGLPMLHRKSLLYTAILLIMIVALLASGARTAWISLTIGAVFLYRNSFFYFMRRSLPVIAVMAIPFFIKFPSFIEMFDIGRFYRTLLIILKELDTFGLDRFGNILIGYGYSYPGMVKSDYSPILSDDLFLVQLVTIFGLIPLVLFVFSVFNVKKYYREDNFFLGAATAILICFLITTFHTNALIRPQLFPFFIMFVVIKNVLSKKNMIFQKK